MNFYFQFISILILVIQYGYLINIFLQGDEGDLLDSKIKFWCLITPYGVILLLILYLRNYYDSLDK